MGYSIVRRQTKRLQEREKYGTDDRTGFHAHGQENNENPLLFSFPSTTENTGVNQCKRDRNIFSPQTHPLKNG